MEVDAHHEQGTDMTASLVKAGHHTDAVGPIAQDFLKPIVMPTAGPEAPDDPSSGSGLTQDEGAVVAAGVAEPSFHLSPRLVLAIVLATVLLSALAIMTVATLAPQGFAAGS